MKKLRALLTSIVVLLSSISASAYDFIVKDGNYKLYYNITSAKDRTVVFAKCIEPQFSIENISGNSCMLNILNPEKFWSTSKILVIQAK